jgi:hypothetical protein
MAGEPTVGARQALLAAVATWISKEFDLPPVDRLPQGRAGISRSDHCDALSAPSSGCDCGETKCLR